MPDYAERDRDMYSLNQRAGTSGNARLRAVVSNSRLRLFILNSASCVGQAGRLRLGKPGTEVGGVDLVDSVDGVDKRRRTRVHARFRSLALVHVRCFVR
jgi:hypothetical protein